MKRLAERWLSFAEKDLSAARHLAEHPALSDMAAFHCQQAVEKSLKGLLSLSEVDTPKIHDLSRLYAIAAREFSLEWQLEELDTVNEFYIETRYPLHEDQHPLSLERQELDRMIRIAEQATTKLKEEICRLAIPDGNSDEPPA